MGTRALPMDSSLPAAARAGGLPRPQQLAALGAVLCLHRAEQGSELTGWAQAVRVETRTGLDSDGLREALHFYDLDGRCCWQIHLLPDSDFFAWERLLSQLPDESGAESGAGVGERLWRRLAGRLRGGHWRATSLRLHALVSEGDATLAASPALLSTLGASTARSIAREEAAEADALSDGCCCVRSAALSVRSPGAHEGAVITFENTERGIA